jgi:DNA (cytosine-5)-methyltransferase 1
LLALNVLPGILAGWAMIGQRALDDPRNSLVMDFVRLVSELDADYFVFENVKGIDGRSTQEISRREVFKDHGYGVRLPWMVLNADPRDIKTYRKRTKR